MWISSAVALSTRIFKTCRSPSPKIYPTIEFVATLEKQKNISHLQQYTTNFDHKLEIFNRRLKPTVASDTFEYMQAFFQKMFPAP